MLHNYEVLNRTEMQLWDPYIRSGIDKLESVQKFALKLVSHQWDANYDHLLELTNVPRLSERRLHLKLVQIYNIIHKLCYFPEDMFQMREAHSERLASCRTDIVHRPFARTSFTTHLYPVVSLLLKMSRCAPIACLHLNVCFILINISIDY